MSSYLQLRNFEKALNADVLKKSQARGSTVPWIKSHVDQSYDPEYSELTLSERGFLQDLRLLAARRANKIPADEKTLLRLLGYSKNTRLGPKKARLVALRFLEPYSPDRNPAANQLFPSGIGLYDGENDSRLDVEVDREKDLSSRPKGEGAKPAATTPVVTPTSNGTSPSPTSPAYRKAQAFVNNGGYALTDYSLKDELAGLGLNSTDQATLLQLADTLRAAATERTPA